VTEDNVPVEIEHYHATELGWQCVDSEKNVWESPTGSLRVWPRRVSPMFAVFRGSPLFLKTRD
jgi:hypothetical protein